MSELNVKQTPASKASFIERRSLDIPAGETKSVNIYGRVFFCNAATAPFTMNFNDGEFFPIVGRGVEWALVENDRYSRLQFKSLVANSIEFYAGNFAYHENVVVPVSKVAQTVIKPWTGAVNVVDGVRVRAPLAAGGVLLLPGTGAAGSGLGYRKQLIVTNLDPLLNLILLDSLDNLLETIPHQQSHVFETSADLKLKSFEATPIYYSVMEMFYTV
jgi:hypothetical protein